MIGLETVVARADEVLSGGPFAGDDRRGGGGGNGGCLEESAA
jgi:hypothetical protein